MSDASSTGKRSSYAIPGTDAGYHGPLAALTGSNGLHNPRSSGNFGAGTAIAFPDELGTEIDHWVTFTSFETRNAIRRPTYQQAGRDSSERVITAQISLPLSQELSTSYQAEYSQESLSAADVEFLPSVDKSAIERSMAGGTMGRDAVKAIRDFSENERKSRGETSIGIGAHLAAGAFNAVSRGGQGLAAFGVARNPHRAMLFEGVPFRRHRFTYRLSPKTRAESDSLRTIIKVFKHRKSPSYGARLPVVGTDLGTHFFKYPDHFEIDFNHPEYLFSIGPSVLIEMDVDYHPNNTPSYVRPRAPAGADADPAPTEVRISLTFVETEIVTRESIEALNR